MSAITTPSAQQLLDQAAAYFQNACDGLRALGTNTRAATWGLRQEVPFERWFADQGFLTPIGNTEDLNKARAWALLATLEGFVRTTAQAATYVFSRFSGGSSDNGLQLEILKAQWQGLQLSAYAILSPNGAKEQVTNSQGNSLIGGPLLDWRWGTQYLPSS